ncbi:MAG TPA: SRPBCC family protein, partial [Solirubrobacteraceae bacterium]
MTMQDTATTSVIDTIVVDAPVDRAFEVFTKEMGTWWPPEHHILEAELQEMVFEPQAGGHIYDRGVDGSECRWSRVLVYEPPTRLVFSWDISMAWKQESDPERTSEVEVRFIEEEPERTRVELEHRNIDRHGEGWEKMRDAVGSPGGWVRGLESFAERLLG